MHNTFTIFALGLLQMSNALTTITISVNTGDCSAPSPTDSYTDSEPASTDLGSATTTSSSDPTTTSSTTYPRSPCPDSPGSSYTDTAGEHYEVYCNTGIIGSDLPAVHATSFDHCLTLCDSYLPLDSTSPACEAVTFISTDVVTGNCQLKFDVKSVILLTYAADSAKLSRIPFSPEVSASISSVLATASETASPISTGEPVSTSVSDSSTSSPSPTSSPSSPNACPCPESDNQTVVDSQNLEYQVACHESKCLNGNNSHT